MKSQFLLLLLVTLGLISASLSTPTVKQPSRDVEVDVGGNKGAVYSQQYARVRVQPNNKASIIKMENVEEQTTQTTQTDITTAQMSTDITLTTESNTNELSTIITPKRDVEELTSTEKPSEEGSGEWDKDPDVVILPGATPNDYEEENDQNDTEHTPDVQTDGFYLYIYHPRGYFQRIINENKQPRSQSYQYQYRHQFH